MNQTNIAQENSRKFDVPIMRSSMLNSPVQANVNLFLAPLIVTQTFPKTTADARREFLRILGEAIPTLARSSEIRTAYDEAADWVAYPLNSNYMLLFEYLKRPRATPTTTFISVAYVSALRALIANDPRETEAVFAGLRPFLQNPSAVRSQARDPMQQYGPDFIAHLVVETEIRASENADWGDSLNAVEADFQRLEAEVSKQLAGAFGRGPEPMGRPLRELVPTDNVIDMAGDPTEKWYRVPAMVALACVYLRCAP